MPSTSSPTTLAALQGLVQRQNQIVLDAAVVAILGDGTLTVEVSGQTITMNVRALIDSEFTVGDAVMLGRNSSDVWFAIGKGSTGALPGPIGGPIQTPSPMASATLHESVLRLVNKHNQILRDSGVTGVFSDGSLAIAPSAPPRTLIPSAAVAPAATTQEFQPGSVVQAIRTDEGGMLVLGG